MSSFYEEFGTFIAEHDRRVADAAFQHGVGRGEFDARVKCREEIEHLSHEVNRLKALQSDHLKGVAASILENATLAIESAALAEVRRQTAIECVAIAETVGAECRGENSLHTSRGALSVGVRIRINFGVER